MDGSLTLRLEDVSKSFARVEEDGIVHALSRIDLEMHDGEFVCIVGASGCGKSTILRLACGLIAPTTGIVTVNGARVEKPGPEIGMVFQKPTLFPWLTVEENIAFSLKIGEKDPAWIEKTERMLSLIGLEQFRNDYPAQLSGGMAQRVALVRSLVSDPTILLLDEPMSALDAFTRMKLQDEVLAIWQQRKPLFVMVTHDVDEAIYMATRVLVMDSNPGRVKEDIAIDLPYPRMRSSQEFTSYRNRILGILGID